MNMMTDVGTNTIETERLILRRFEYEDSISMLRNWVADDEVQWGYGEPSYKTEEQARELLTKYISSYDNEHYYRWAIIEKASGECIGQVAYYYVYARNNLAEIEYCIGAAYQGKGYATEATKAVITYGFEQIKLHRVQICCRDVNEASRKVIEKCGLTYKGTLRDYFWRNDHYEGRMFFSVLREEYGMKNSDF